MVNLDTHILLGVIGRRLRPAEQRVLEDAWVLCPIVFWEIAWLERERRIQRVLDTPEFNQLVANLTVYPITATVARAIRRLDFRSDPADELIAATSLVHDVPLLTRDARILASKIVPLAVP